MLTREGGFYPQALEKGLRNERTLTLALAKMYMQDVSTRKVTAITKQLCGASVSSAMVSQATAQMDLELEKWCELTLGEYPYLFLDVYYEQVREDGRKEWKNKSGYHVRSLAETTMFRLKTIFGDELSSRLIETQTTQALVRCAALNKMTHLCMPQSYIASPLGKVHIFSFPSNGLRLLFDLCTEACHG